MEDKLIAAGVKNLHAYGYPQCDKHNILTDEIYRAFFASMLKDNKGKAGAAVDKAIDALLAKCDAQRHHSAAVRSAGITSSALPTKRKRHGKRSTFE